jgi:hypothetical protein
VTRERVLAWEGCHNVRDLGGLPAADGRTTRWGAVIRSDALDELSAAGWEALRSYGIRTIVDLRNHDELPASPPQRPAGLTTVHVPLDGVEHTDFWDEWASGPQFGTPLYYRPHLDRFPELSARALAAVARAEPGGVLVHCVGGRDRTGQISMLLLALVGVAPEAIAADYTINTDNAEYLAGRGTSSAEVIAATLADLDVPARLRSGGLGDDDLAALRARLVT